MAASHSNRSPSPVSSRPCNPNSRIPECRKSFSGNNTFVKPSVLTNSRKFDPFTPANSPSDFGRSRSEGKEGDIADSLHNEEKENDEKDMTFKGTKIPTKFSKNFMSPTISAASKFTPSPRKKVLVERNDPVRTSISLTDGKAMFFSALSSDISENSEPKPKPNINQDELIDDFLDSDAADSEKNEAVLKGPAVSSKTLKKVTFLDVTSDSHNASESFSESVITESDEISFDSNSNNKNSCPDVCQPIAPLDADPSMPPYDPKTNYLSPRPQFLHYKPNPRIETILSKNGLDADEFMRLEDSFMAEITSENISGSEESPTEDDSQTDEYRLTVSADMVVGLSEMEVSSPAFEPSERLPVSSSFNSGSSENLEQKMEKKQWGFSRLMLGSVILMLLVGFASLSFTDSPVVDEFLVFKDLSFSNLSNFYHQLRVASLAKERLESLAGHVDRFRIDSMSFISELINKLGGREEIGHLRFANLTELQEVIWNEEHFRIGHEFVENLEENELEEEEDTDLEVFEEAEVDSDENFEKEIDFEEAEVDSDENSEKEIEGEVEKLEGKSPDPESENVILEPEIETEMEMNINSDDSQFAASLDQENTIESENVEMPTETTDSENLYGETDLGSSTGASEITSESSMEEGEGMPKNSIILESPPQMSEDSSLLNYMVGILALVVALSAATAFIYLNKRKRVLVAKKDPLVTDKNTGTSELNFHDRRISQTIVDLIGESYPSEMSSIQRSAFEELKEASEVQSLEKKAKKHSSKRESLTSSSEYSAGSTSFGSFTTFERIPIKHSKREDEVITPVRRSSRIRNQVVSP